METLKKVLDKRVKKTDEELLWEEIRNIFLNLPVRTLRKGVNLKIFPHSERGYLVYTVNKTSNNGLPFCQDYSLKVLEDALLYCKGNGLDISSESESYIISYHPNS